MKKKFTYALIVTACLICVLPFPQKVVRRYYGINTETGERVDMELNMKYLRFLLLSDKMYGTVAVKNDTETVVYGEHLHYVGQSRSKNNAGDYAHDFNGWYYNNTMYIKEYEDGTTSKVPVGFEGVSAHISSDFNKILILHNTSGKIENQNGGRYIGSTAQNQQDEAKAYFLGYYD